MKPYSEYTAEELAMERLFIRWVRSPDDQAIRQFWINWVDQHPHRAAAVQAARELVGTVSEWEEDELANSEASSLWGRIRSSVSKLPEIERFDSTLESLMSNRYLWKWSVGIVMTVMIILFWFFQQPAEFPIVPSEKRIAEMDSTQAYTRQDSTQKSIFLK